MKRIVFVSLVFVLACAIMFGGNIKQVKNVYAKDVNNKYYTVYDADSPDKVIFVKGEGVNSGDEYVSSDNKLYEIIEVDEQAKTGKAKFIEKVSLPVYNVTRKNNIESVSAAAQKKIGLYHTHNDECYLDADGTDSIYGKGGIHDIGRKFKSQMEKLGVDVVYSENLHLPHNSGAYTRSQTTASQILDKGNIAGLFDMHRDATPKKEYETTVNGEQMSKVRMVVGAANQNSAENKEFAYAIKSYADEVYPGLIKDIYIGKGNYNQQLTPRAMLFEMGCHNTEKSKVLKSTIPLSKTVDMVLFGSKSASAETLGDVNLVNAAGEPVSVTGLAQTSNNASASFVWILLGGIAFYGVVLGILCAFNKEVRYKTGRFFSETFAGVFGKKKAKKS